MRGLAILGTVTLLTTTPEIMAQKVRFIHSSDWQLGMTRAFFSAEAGARFSQARIDAIVELGRKAAEYDADFVVVAGDVFESNQLSRQIVVRTLDALATIKVPIFLLPGNHDPLDGASIFSTPELQAASAQGTIRILSDHQPVQVPGCPLVDVVGAPWRTKHPSGDLCAELAATLAPTPHKLRVAVAHGQLDRLSPNPAQIDTISLAQAEAALAAQKFHYLALGDRHSVYSAGNTGRVWYSGAPVATAFDEDQPNQALLVELALDEPCTVQPFAVGDWHFVARHQMLSTPEDLAELAAWLQGLPNKHCSAVKVSFEGAVSLSLAAELDELMDSQQDAFASLRRRVRHTSLAVVPDVLDQDSLGLSGYAKSSWDELLAEANADDPVAQDALRLFYRLSNRAD